MPGYDPITIEIKGGTVFSLIVLVVVAYIGEYEHFITTIYITGRIGVDACN